MSCSDDDDIGSFRDFGEIFRLTIAARHGCSGVHEHEIHRLTDDIRPADDSDIFSLHLDIIVGEERHDAFRSTAPETIMSEEHIADLCTSESIDILLGCDTLRDGIAIDMRWKWCLHDDAVNLLIL